MKLGIRSHDLKQSKPYLDSKDITDGLNKYGIDGLQLVCFKTFESIKQLPNSVSQEFCKSLADTLKSAGKEVILIGSYFNPVHSDSKKVENCISVFKEYLKYSPVFANKVVASETGSFNDDKWTYHPKNRTEQALNTVINTFTDLCGFAQKHDVNVGIEGAAGHVCYDVLTLKKAYNSINCNNLKIVFDLYNFLETDNYADYFKILNQGLESFDKKIHCFHLKDFVLENNNIKQAAIGKGMIDYKKYLKTIKDYDKDANLILEGTAGEDIAPSVEMIRQIWDSV